MLLAFAGAYEGKPLSPTTLDFLRKSTIPDFKGSFVGKRAEMVSVSIETADKNHSFSTQVKREENQVSYVLNAFAQGAISK
jgi:hypothetical protein